MINDILKEKLKFYIQRFESQSDEIKSQVHYQSVLNITEQLTKIVNDSKPEKLKKEVIIFFKQIENIDFLIGKIESLELYNSYLLKSGQFLVKRKDFRSNTDIIKYISLGILLDFGIFYLTKDILPFYFPILTFILTFLGYKSRNKKKMKKKYFAIGY